MWILLCVLCDVTDMRPDSEALSQITHEAQRGVPFVGYVIASALSFETLLELVPFLFMKDNFLTGWSLALSIRVSRLLPLIKTDNSVSAWHQAAAEVCSSHRHKEVSVLADRCSRQPCSAAFDSFYNRRFVPETVSQRARALYWNA